MVTLRWIFVVIFILLLVNVVMIARVLSKAEGEEHVSTTITRKRRVEAKTKTSLDKNKAAAMKQEHNDIPSETTTIDSASINSVDNHSTNDSVARIFYLIIIHNARTMLDSLYLLQSICHPLNILLIHIDQKYYANITTEDDDEEYQQFLQHVDQCSSIVQVESIYNVEWSKWSMNLPTLWGMEQAISNSSYKNQWDLFINLSGDTLPVFDANVMSKLWYQILQHGNDNNEYKVTPNTNFITSSTCETGWIPTSVDYFPSFWHKRTHYQNPHDVDAENHFIHFNENYDPVISYKDHAAAADSKEEERNQTITTHFGSQWIVLQPNFVQYLIHELQRPDSLSSRFKDYLIQTNKLMTDETFIPTIIMNTYPYNESLPFFHEHRQSPTVNDAEKYSYYSWMNSNTNDNNNNNRIDDDHHHNNDGSPKKAFTIVINNNDDNNKQQENSGGYSSSFVWNMTTVRYERMDEHVPTAYGQFPNEQRYDVPKVSSSKMDETTSTNEEIMEIPIIPDVPKLWGPYFLGVYDLGNIIQSGALYIRKVSQYIDPNMVHLLPVSHPKDIPHITWPKDGVGGISLTEVPSWEKTKRQLIQKAKEAEKQQQQQQQQQQQREEKENQDVEEL